MLTRRLTTTMLLTVFVTVMAAGGAQAFWKKNDVFNDSAATETRTLELSDFDKVDVGGAFDVTIDRDDWYEMMVIARGRSMPWGQRPYVYLKER